MVGLADCTDMQAQWEPTVFIAKLFNSRPSEPIVVCWYTHAVKTFNPTSEHPARPVQAWQIMIGKAMNRQTVTYEGLSELMYGKQAAGVLAAILGHIAF